MTSTPRRLAAVALAASLAVTAAGCSKSKSSGASSKDPKTALTAATKALNGHRQVSFSLKLSDPDGSLRKELTTGKDHATAAQADAVLGGTVTIAIAAHDDKKLSDLKPGASKVDFSLDVSSKGSSIVSILFNGSDLYAKLGVQAIGKLDPKAAASLGQLGQLSPDLAKGSWVRVAGVDQLIKQFAGAGAPKPSANPSAKAFLTGIQDAFFGAATFTDEGNGKTGFSVDVKQIVTALQTAYGSLASSLGSLASGGAALQQDLGKVPAGNVTGTVTTSNGELSDISVDLDSISKLAKAGGSTDAPALGTSTIDLGFSSSDSGLTPPSGAKDLNLLPLLSGLLGGSAG